MNNEEQRREFWCYVYKQRCFICNDNDSAVNDADLALKEYDKRFSDNDLEGLGFGWIKWGGGDCPLSDDNSLVDVIYRHGGADLKSHAWEFEWVHHDKDCAPEDHMQDIVAYRVVETEL